MKIFFATLVLSQFALALTQSLECGAPAETTTAMNRFTMTGTIETSEKSGTATAQLTGTTQMAGLDSVVNSSPTMTYKGTTRIYPAKSLGVNEVTVVQMRAELNGRALNLTVASGLTGPQSTLTIQGIPFRAECKLK